MSKVTLRGRSAQTAAAAAFVLLLAVCPPASAQCNANPIAAADTVVYSGGTVLVVDVLGNDVEPDGEALTVDNLSTTCPGTVSEDFGLVTLTVAGLSADCLDFIRLTGFGPRKPATADLILQGSQ